MGQRRQKTSPRLVLEAFAVALFSGLLAYVLVSHHLIESQSYEVARQRYRRNMMDHNNWLSGTLQVRLTRSPSLISWTCKSRSRTLSVRCNADASSAQPAAHVQDSADEQRDGGSQ
jgi:hypothetical protein